MPALTERQTKWLTAHYKHTKNAEIAARLGISESYLHRVARSLGLKKTKQFMRKTQANATAHAQVAMANETPEQKERRRQQANQNRNPDRCFKPGIYALGCKTAEELAKIDAKRAATWRKTRQDDEMRLNWYGEQQTKFHYRRHPDPEKNRRLTKLRHYFRKIGYDIPSRSGMVAYFDDETKRTPKLEAEARNLGMIIRQKAA